MTVEIIGRDQWGAEAADGAADAPLPAQAVWVHHTAGRAGSATATLEKDCELVRHIEDIGVSRGFGTISYTFVVTRAGRIFEGHSVGRRGAHTRGQNTVARAIVLPGDYHTKLHPTKKQTEAVAQLLVHGWREGWWDEPKLAGGHRDAPGASTACPGDRLHAAISDINARAAELAGQSAPAEDSTMLVAPGRAELRSAQTWAESKRAHPRFVSDILPALWDATQALAAANQGRTIDFTVVAAQSAKETGFGKFGGVLDPSFHNTAGIKTAKGGGNYDPDAHQRFDSWAEGARAHLNHLAAYTGLTPVGEPHGRYHTVMRLSWAGSVRTAEDLGARWAPSGKYGESVAAMAAEIAALEPEPVAPVAPEPVAEEPAATESELTKAQKAAAARLQAQADDIAEDKPERPMLRLGDRSDDVRDLQALLGITADGIFGPITERTVRSFQASRSLSVDGIVGPNTWQALDARAAEGTPPTLRKGDRGDDVLRLQLLLAARNPHFRYRRPGTFDKTTQLEVRAHQRRHRLKVDGIVGPITWGTL